MKKNNIFNFNFISLLIATLVSRAGTIIYTIALTWWLVNVTNSAKSVGIILAVSFLPVAIFGPLFGVLSDRWNKKHILVITDLISGLISIFVGVFAYFNMINLYFLIASSFLLGCCSALFQPTVKSIIPLIIHKDRLVKANSIINGLSEVIKVISPMIAGGILATAFLGPWVAFVLNGISFLISAVLEYFIKYNHKPCVNTETKIFSNFIDGLDYIKKNHNVRDIIFLVTFVNIFISSYDVLMPLFVKNVLNQSSGYYAKLLTVYALGGVSISLALLFWVKLKHTRLIFAISLSLISLSLICMSLIPNHYAMYLWVFLYGLCIVCFETVFITYVQTIIDSEYLGRTFSIIFLLAVVIAPVSYCLFGLLGDFIIDKVFVYSGIGILITMGLFFMKSIKMFRIGNGSANQGNERKIES